MKWKPEGWVPTKAGLYWMLVNEDKPDVVRVYREGKLLFVESEAYNCTVSVLAKYETRWAGPLRAPRLVPESDENAPPWVLYRDPKGSDTSRDVTDTSMIGIALDLEKKILDKLPTIAINSYGWGRFKKEVKALMQDGLNATNLNEVFDYYENHYARLQGWTGINLKINSMMSLGKALGAWKARTGELKKPGPTIRLWEE